MAFPLRFMNVEGLSNTKVRPLNFTLAILPSFSTSKSSLGSLTSASSTLNPTLCLVSRYSFPIFPRPTIRYFTLRYAVMLAASLLRCWCVAFCCWCISTFSSFTAFCCFAIFTIFTFFTFFRLNNKSSRSFNSNNYTVWWI